MHTHRELKMLRVALKTKFNKRWKCCEFRFPENAGAVAADSLCVCAREYVCAEESIQNK